MTGKHRKMPDLLAGKLYKNAYSRSQFGLWGLVIQEIRVSFSQFVTFRYPLRSFLHWLAVVFSILCRPLLGRSLKYSFAHQGEDRVLEGLIKPRIQYPGYFVEVGCNRPKFFSNTYGLYRKGWRGICVDANPSHIRQFGWYRPRDIAVCALVAEQEEDQPFYLIQNDVLSTSQPDFLNEYQQQGLAVRETKMKGRTLTSILDNAGAPTRFDLLSVDAEEQDLEVLRSLDWSRYRPQWVVVEDETFEMGKIEENPICAWMIKQGYRVEGFVLKNLYFKEEG